VGSGKGSPECKESGGPDGSGVTTDLASVI